jgi:hypothetical protein
MANESARFLSLWLSKTCTYLGEKKLKLLPAIHFTFIQPALNKRDRCYNFLLFASEPVIAF